MKEISHELQVHLKLTEGESWIYEARQIAAQCWLDPETAHIEMDSVLCEAVARRMCNWLQYRAEQQKKIGLLQLQLAMRDAEIARLKAAIEVDRFFSDADKATHARAQELLDSARYAGRNRLDACCDEIERLRACLESRKFIPNSLRDAEDQQGYRKLEISWAGGTLPTPDHRLGRGDW